MSPADEVERLLQFLYLVPVGVAETDLDGAVLRLNPLATQTFMLAAGGPVINAFEALANVFPGLRSRVLAREGIGVVVESEQFTLSPNARGDKRIMSLAVHRIDGERLAFVINDITRLVEQEQEIRQREAQLRAVVDSVRTHLISTLDEAGRIQDHNASIERLTGMGPEIAGQTAGVLFVEPSVLVELIQSAGAHGWAEREAPMRNISGSEWWGTSVLTRISADVPGITSGYALVTREDTERHKRELQLKTWATQDPLTGATNRRAFQGLVKLELDRARRDGTPCSFALLDIDHFKGFNDTHGHETGDDVLKLLVERLHGCVRRPDYLVRMGGEEFGFLLPDTDEAGLASVAERARAAVAEAPFKTRSGRLPLRVSVGGVTSLVPVSDFDQLYHAADQALYRAKEKGRNRVELAPPIS